MLRTCRAPEHGLISNPEHAHLAKLQQHRGWLRLKIQPAIELATVRQLMMHACVQKFARPEHAPHAVKDRASPEQIDRISYNMMPRRQGWW